MTTLKEIKNHMFNYFSSMELDDDNYCDDDGHCGGKIIQLFQELKNIK